MSTPCLVIERYGSASRRKYLIQSVKEVYPKIETEGPQLQSIQSFFVNVFLPHDYPNSVSKDYIQYQFWDTIQAFASSITGSICTHAVLKGYGVGDENASPVAATITWLLKDGASMFGRIGFAWLQGTKLDSDCKKWRLFADVINDLTMLLDLLSGYFQHHFMLLVCISGVLKSLVGVAGGCTRAALTQHQARKNNMGDVSAKDGSQETLVNLVALLCSLIIIPIVTKSIMMTWIIFIAMTVLHLTANYFAVKSVVMEKFNVARFSIYTQHFLQTKKCLSVSEVNKRENVFFQLWTDNIQVKLGVSFKDAIQDLSCKEIESLLNIYKGKHFILRVFEKSSSKRIIYVVFTESASINSEIEALYEVCCVKKVLQEFIKTNDKNTFMYEVMSRKFAADTFEKFLKQLESSEFNMEHGTFNIDLWRAKWE